jgi:hypothetical protein
MRAWCEFSHTIGLNRRVTESSKSSIRCGAPEPRIGTKGCFNCAYRAALCSAMNHDCPPRLAACSRADSVCGGWKGSYRRSQSAYKVIVGASLSLCGLPANHCRIRWSQRPRTSDVGSPRCVPHVIVCPCAGMCFSPSG